MIQRGYEIFFRYFEIDFKNLPSLNLIWSTKIKKINTHENKKINTQENKKINTQENKKINTHENKKINTHEIKK